jgi:hypothetical protein
MKPSLAAMALLLLSSCSKEEAKGSLPSASALAPSPPVASALSAPPPSSGSATPAAPGAGSPGAAGSSGSADAPPPPKCPAGLVGNSVPAYCIKLPAGYSVKQSRISATRGSIEYDTGTTTDNLMVTYDDSPIARLSKDVESEMKFGGDRLDKKGSLPAGNKWFQGTHGDYARLVTLVKGPGTLTIKCSFAYQPKKAPSKEAIDSCRSIVVP